MPIRSAAADRMPPDRLRPRPAFVQFINPEILRLYGHSAALGTDQLYSWSLRLTRYALLASCKELVFPASYLFEVQFFDRLLKQLRPLRDGGFTNIASPTPDLDRYAEKKRKEYREELFLFPEYETPAVPEWSTDPHAIWRPRTERSASADIAAAWHNEIRAGGILSELLASRAGRFQPLSKWETRLANVPRLLEERAFIQRFVEPVLPFELEPYERTRSAMLLSRAYLESYLLEFDAFVLCDTPLGSLDCGLPEVAPTGALMKIRYGPMANLLNVLGVKDVVEKRLGWRQYADLISRPITHWLARCLMAGATAPDEPLEAAIVEARYRTQSPLTITAEFDAVTAVADRFWAFREQVGPAIESRMGSIEDVSIKPPGHSPGHLIILDGRHHVSGNDVFLVHGRDEATVNSFKAILRAASITPLDWEQAVELTAIPFT